MIPLQKPLNWYLVLAGTKERQTIYHIDKPSYEFTAQSKQRGPDTVRVVDAAPKWKPIALELPTVMTEEVATWLDTGRKQDMEVFCISADGVLLEHWFIQKARIRDKRVKRGRRINTNVMSLLVDYDWWAGPNRRIG
jgi:hypothetical protein